MIEFIIFYLIVGLILNILLAVPYLRTGEYKLDWVRTLLWVPIWPYTLWLYISGRF